jgi:multicomponent Na+:H+ antiporter subunit G
MPLTDWIGMGFVVFGLFFFVVGIVGVLRLPDARTRLHASGKVATLGLFGLLVGGSFLVPPLMPRLLLLGLFFLLTAPAASHVIALTDRALRTDLLAPKPADENRRP